MNHKLVLGIMREMGLRGKPPYRKWRTTNSDHPFPGFPNLVQGLVVVRPDQVWVADITYIRLRREFIYLAVIRDVFTRCIRGWQLGRSLDQELTLTALRRALAHHQPQIHHSDQGVQYPAPLSSRGEPGPAVRAAKSASGPDVGVGAVVLSHILALFETPIAKITVWRDVQAVGQALRGRRWSGKVKVIGADEPMVRLRGKGVAMGAGNQCPDGGDHRCRPVGEWTGCRRRCLVASALRGHFGGRAAGKR